MAAQAVQRDEIERLRPRRDELHRTALLRNDFRGFAAALRREEGKLALIAEIKKACEINLTSIARKDCTLSAGDHDFHAALGAARLALVPSPSGRGPG